MLSIGKMSVGQEAYYLDLAQEDYYFGGGEPEGRWLGGGAARLGLRGVVSRESLSSLFRGFTPDGTARVKNAGKKDRQAGWDFTFSVPKPVSVLWSQASESIRREVQEAVAAAVEKTIAYLEREAAFSRVGRGGTERIRSELVVAAFPHGTSRALDPNYHVHCLVLNVGVGEDGKTRTIVSKSLYDLKMVAGVFFRAQLAAELERRLGLHIERPLDRNGEPKSWFDLKGIPEKLCKFFSKRRAAIEQELGARGLESATAAAFATLGTREAKAVVPPRQELFKQWQDEGRKCGFTHRTVEKLLGPPKRRDRVAEYRAALAEAVERITFSQSHFSENDLVRYTLEASQGRGIDATFVAGWVRHDLETSPQFVNLGMRNGQRRYTTPEILDVEKELLGSVAKLRRAKFTSLPKRVVREVVEKVWSGTPTRRRTVAGKTAGKVVDAASGTFRGFRLNSEQAAAVRYLTRKPGRVKVVCGLAGTGKTTMLRAAREAFEGQGYRVVGCALAGVAAKRLQEGSGIESDTVRMRLLQLYPKPWRMAVHHVRQLARAARKKRTYSLGNLKINRKTVVVLDEAGMIGTRDFALLAKAVQRGGGILVCVGDKGQLPSIEAGGAFGSIAERFGSVNLQEVTRQKDACDREAVKRIPRGEAEEVIKDYAKRGDLHVADNRDGAEKRLITDWSKSGGVKDPARHVIFASTNAEVDRYNELAQARRERDGEVNMARSVTVGSETLGRGDRVVFLKKSRKLGVENGDVGTLISVHAATFTSSITVRLDGSHRDVDVPISSVKGSSYKALRRAYAFTTHKLQGATVVHAYVHLGGAMTDQEMTYVQLSRHQETLRLYTDQWEAGVALTNLAREGAGDGEPVRPTRGQRAEDSAVLSAVGKSRVEDLAHDVLEQSQDEPLELNIQR